MRSWLIGYNLEIPGLEHLDFFSALKEAGAKRILPALWVVESEKSAIELRDYFAQFLTTKDQLIVAALGGELVSWGALTPDIHDLNY